MCRAFRHDPYGFYEKFSTLLSDYNEDEE